mmetsp:Transcript_33632/g.69959  ORF Transcript_33632/g.69959 Transcript_33632/m.69959 type:complete len:104 (-) Transcript_33632:680-991(-)
MSRFAKEPRPALGMLDLPTATSVPLRMVTLSFRQFCSSAGPNGGSVQVSQLQRSGSHSREFEWQEHACVVQLPLQSQPRKKLRLRAPQPQARVQNILRCRQAQ